MRRTSGARAVTTLVALHARGIKDFRGMESPVVILCEVNDLLEHQLIEGCYVGMSRAQLLLAIAGLPGTLERIRTIDLMPVVKQRVRHAARRSLRQRDAQETS